MPLAITFTRRSHDPRRVTLNNHSKIDVDFVQVAMEKQLKLVSHALIRGQNLPTGENLPLGVTFKLMRELRLANIQEPHRRTLSAGQVPSKVPGRGSLFECCFGIVDVGERILHFVQVRDMKALAGVSKACRAMTVFHLTTWDLGEMDLGNCDMPNRQPGDCNVPGPDVWVHGRSDYTSRHTASRLPEEQWYMTDHLLLAEPAATLGLLCAAGNLSEGRPLRRIRHEGEDTEVAFTRPGMVSKMQRNAVRRFQMMPDQAKDNPIYKKWTRIQPLLAGFANYGQRIQRLYLDRVSFLDLRFIAVALENLPQLRDLAIDSCELMHMGCLVPLLDMLHWFGARRGGKLIKLDFFPKAWFGPVRNRMATSILTFGPAEEPRGAQAVMAAALVAIMKAAYMGYDVVAEDSLLERFLLLVPMEFGLMSFFLREVKDLVSLCATRETWGPYQGVKHDVLVHQILAALVQPSQGSLLEVIRADHFMPSLAHLMMHECRACRHSFLKYLLHPEHWSRPSDQSICLPCSLERIIEADDQAWLPEKRDVVNTFFNNVPRPAPGFEVPNPVDQICPVVSNPFVRHPKPKDVSEPEQEQEPPPQGPAGPGQPVQQPGQQQGQETGIEERRAMAQQEWLAMMGPRFRYGEFASEELRTVHRHEDKFWYTGNPMVDQAALLLDSRNRFAEIIGLHLENGDKGLQPRRQYYSADATWEAIYGSNVSAQGYPVPVEDLTQWAPLGYGR